MQDIVKVASKIIGTQQLFLADIYEGLVLKKAQEILASFDHPLFLSPLDDITGFQGPNVTSINCLLSLL